MRKWSLPAAMLLAWLPISVCSSQDPSEFAKPGVEHKQLQRLVGDWKVEVKYYFDESGKPTESAAKATFRSLLGGRYLQQRFTGEIQGQAFTGLGITGYDKAKKKYVAIWIDNMGTSILNFVGEYDVKTNTMTEVGVGGAPGGEMKYKNVTKYESNDKFVFTMYLVAQEEKKMMEATYIRAKKTPGKKKGQQKKEKE